MRQLNKKIIRNTRPVVVLGKRSMPRQEQVRLIQRINNNANENNLIANAELHHQPESPKRQPKQQPVRQRMTQTSKKDPGSIKFDHKTLELTLPRGVNNINTIAKIQGKLKGCLERPKPHLDPTKINEVLNSILEVKERRLNHPQHIHERLSEVPQSQDITVPDIAQPNPPITLPAEPKENPKYAPLKVPDYQQPHQPQPYYPPELLMEHPRGFFEQEDHEDQRTTFVVSRGVFDNRRVATPRQRLSQFNQRILVPPHLSPSRSVEENHDFSQEQLQRTMMFDSGEFGFDQRQYESSRKKAKQRSRDVNWDRIERDSPTLSKGPSSILPVVYEEASSFFRSDSPKLMRRAPVQKENDWDDDILFDHPSKFEGAFY